MTSGLLTKLASNLTIKDKKMQVVRFEPNWAQREFYDEAERQFADRGRVRIIVLKARQLGISTATEAMAFNLSFVFPGYRAMVLAHEIPASQNLLEMTHRYWDNYDFKRLYTTESYSKNDIGWVETGSRMKIATAGNKGAGRSSTIHFLHASEMAFYPDPKIVMTGLTQTIPESPGTVVVAESTANGRGNYFHQQWLLAEQGETEFVPLFFPWHKHPEYRASAIGIPHFNLGKLTDDEKVLKRIGVDDDRLAWRRWAIANKCQSDVLIFMQEYPSNPEEAFIATGMNVFPGEHLSACYDPQDGVRGLLQRNGNEVTFKAASDGPLTLFKRPHEDTDWGKYLVAGDPTKTTMGDYAVAQVLNRRTMEQVAVWRGRLDPVTFGEELFKLGLYYNTAMVTTEIEGPGYGTVGKLIGMNYPNIWQRQNKADKTPGAMTASTFGWSTTHQTKPLAIGWLLKFVVDHALTIHDRKTYDEMVNYVTLDNGSYGNGNNEEHDDTVMSLALGVTCHIMDAPLQAYGTEADEMREDWRDLMNDMELT